MDSLFSHTLLRNKDVAYLFGEKPTIPTNWRRKYNDISPKEIPYKKKKILAWDFKDLYNVRRLIYPDTLNTSNKVVLFLTLKGGVSKTCTASQVAFSAALQGYKVLFVDLDHQQDGTSAIGVPYNGVKHTIYNVLVNETPIEESIIELNHNLHVIGANNDLFSINDQLRAKINRVELLDSALSKIKDSYDLIILDAHNDKSILNMSAIAASDIVAIPSFCVQSSVNGVINVVNFVTDIISEKGIMNNEIVEDYEPIIKKHVRIIPTK